MQISVLIKRHSVPFKTMGELLRLLFSFFWKGKKDLVARVVVVHPGTDTSVDDRWNLLFKLDKLEFQPSKQGGQELPGLILQSMIDGTSQ